MTNRRWIWMTALTVIFFAGAEVAFMFAVDPYGLYRNTAGRQLFVVPKDRVGKYFLNEHYVPANFDGLIVGPSSSVNWRPEILGEGIGISFYNDSLHGTNASEMKLIVDPALKHGHFKAALVAVQPYMFNTHRILEGLDKADEVQDLGSLQAYETLAFTHLLPHPIRSSSRFSTANGTYEIEKRLNVPDVPIDFTVDPIALQAFQELLREMQSQGIRIVYLVPPYAQPKLVANQERLTRFYTDMWPLLPQAPIINLNGQEYVDFRSNKNNFIDSYHLSPEAGVTISKIINGRLKATLGTN